MTQDKRFSRIVKNYYYLTKPGIIYGNAITVIAGFFLASKDHINFLLFFTTLFGICFVIASACVFNNYIDRGIDEKMSRTKNRVLVRKSISGRNAIVYACILGLLGFADLFIFTNLLTVFLGMIALFVYVVLYGISKRKSIHGTIIGSIAGALPLVAGYTAVTNKFDSGAVTLLIIMIIWQMPHFYAIAIYRLPDYAAAGLPVLPVRKGIFITKIHMLLYTIAFPLAIVMLTFFGYTGYGYLLIMSLLSFFWIGFSLFGFKTAGTKTWARKMFILSLVILVVFSFMISVDIVR